MELSLSPNGLCSQNQTIQLNKINTLIGENGSGKSCILQSIFEKGLSREALTKNQVVCFSSGQNER